MLRQIIYFQWVMRIKEYAAEMAVTFIDWVFFLPKIDDSITFKWAKMKHPCILIH